MSWCVTDCCIIPYPILSAGDQRARAALASTFEILKAKYFFPFSDRERDGCSAKLPEKCWMLFIYEEIHKFSLPATFWLINRHNKKRYIEGEKYNGIILFCLSQKPVTQRWRMQVRGNSRVPSHAESGRSCSPSGKPADYYSQGWPGCSGNHGCSSPRSRPVGAKDQYGKPPMRWEQRTWRRPLLQSVIAAASWEDGGPHWWWSGSWQRKRRKEVSLKENVKM